MNMLAFDLGGSGGKITLGKFDGSVISLETVHRFEHRPCLINNGLYWDIINIYNQMNTGIKKAIGITKDNIDSFGIDSFSNDFAFLSENGDLMTPVRCYRDSRTQKYREKIYNKMSPNSLYSLTGNQNARFNTLMQLAAMREAGEGYIIDNASKMLFTPDLLIRFLTGKSVSEYTISSVSQMYSYADNGWCKKILDTYKIPESLFGKLVKPGTIVGKTADDYNAKIGTAGFKVVSVCEHDTASAFLASVCEGDCAIISSGTWALVGTEVEKPIINDYGRKFNVANEGGFKGHHRLLRNVMGTWLLQEIRSDYREKGEDYSYAEMEKLAGSENPFEFLIDVDDELFFEPGNMPGKIRNYCMKIYGKAPSSIGALVRCVYDSLVFKYRYTVEILEKLTGKKFSAINIVGGGSKDKLMGQLTADVCGKTVFAGPCEATSLGNILVQLIAAGKISSIEEGRNIIKNSFGITVFNPHVFSTIDGKYKDFKNLFNLE